MGSPCICIQQFDQAAKSATLSLVDGGKTVTIYIYDAVANKVSVPGGGAADVEFDYQRDYVVMVTTWISNVERFFHPALKPLGSYTVAEEKRTRPNTLSLALTMGGVTNGVVWSGARPDIILFEAKPAMALSWAEFLFFREVIHAFVLKVPGYSQS